MYAFQFGSKDDPNILTVPTALIGLASDAQSGGSMFELKIDGIFGLGPPRSDDLCGFESPLYTAYHNKLINKSIFSVYMHNSKDSGNGEYGGGEKGLQGAAKVPVLLLSIDFLLSILFHRFYKIKKNI
ncbi:unnamed protein product [Meloidogyne enterolobii]|uniref:Uncharacterized protein n=1 Tax=Meloidogyne enterolobii TaxID=390850 RepID=A0ACB0YI64_MELEN